MVFKVLGFLPLLGEIGKKVDKKQAIQEVL